MYVDFTYYKDTYKGLLDEATFIKSEQEAVDNLNARLLRSYKIPKLLLGTHENLIKRVICELADNVDIFNQQLTTVNSEPVNVSSESVKNHSISYDKSINKEKLIKDYDFIVEKTIRKLFPTGLLYTGI